MSKIAERLSKLNAEVGKPPFASDPHETVVRVRAEQLVRQSTRVREGQFRFNWSNAERTLAERLVEDAGYGATIAGLLRAAVRVADANPEFREAVIAELKRDA